MDTHYMYVSTYIYIHTHTCVCVCVSVRVSVTSSPFHLIKAGDATWKWQIRCTCSSLLNSSFPEQAPILSLFLQLSLRAQEGPGERPG